MAPTKPNDRKSKGVASTPLSKRTKWAGSKRLATPLTVNQLSDDNVPVSMQDDFLLEAFIEVFTDLSTHVAANEECHRQGQAASSTCPPTSLPRQTLRHGGAPAPLPDVAQEIHRSVARRIRQVPAYTSATTEGDTSEEEEQLAPRWKKHLKSDLHRTGANTSSTRSHGLTRYCTPWMASPPPTRTSQYPSISLFVKGYLIVMVHQAEDGCPSQGPHV